MIDLASLKHWDQLKEIMVEQYNKTKVSIDFSVSLRKGQSKKKYIIM